MKRVELAMIHTKQRIRAYKEAKQTGQKLDRTQLGNPEDVEGENPNSDA
jgi:hypothetical protein